MRSIDVKKLLPIAAGIVLFVALVLTFFNPVLEGMRLRQGDIAHYMAMSRETVEHRELYGEEPLWDESAFSGMPAYQISVMWPAGPMKFLERMFHGFLPEPAGVVFLMLVGMFIFLLSLRIDPWLCIVGAVAFGFSSYYLIILPAGHNSKANAIGYMPLVLCGLVMLLRGRKWLGAALFALFLTMEVRANHPQVAYYLAILLALFGLAELWRAIREKRSADYFSRAALAVVGAGLAVFCNIGLLYGTFEYGKFTTRGKGELTIKPDGSSASQDRTGGLDRSYVTHWSYGKQETFTFLVPNVKGGASGSLIKSREDLDKISDPILRNEIMKTYQEGGYVKSYWGDQEFTSGPVYLGIVVVLLMLLLLARAEGMARWWILGSLLLIAVLLNVTSPIVAGLLVIAYLIAGIFLWKDTLAYALFSALLLTMMLAWGQYYMPLTDFFLDHVPGYDKFRAVTIILVIVELCAPVLAVLFVDRFLKEEPWGRTQRQWFLYPTGVLLLLLLVMSVAPASLFSVFSDEEKAVLQDQNYIAGLKDIRASILSQDAWRGVVFLLIGAGLVYGWGRRWLAKPLFIGSLGVVILADLWTVDRRYVNTDRDEKGNYLQWEDLESNKYPYAPQKADMFILQQEQNANTEADYAQAIERLRAKKAESGAITSAATKLEEVITRFGSLRRTTHYRVLNMRDPFNDPRDVYFHKSLGGYHGAKLKRYQDLISFHIGREMQETVGELRKGMAPQRVDSIFAGQGVLNMLNTKYLIFQNDQPALRNPRAYGVGWFADQVRTVANADEEIMELGKIDTRHVAVMDQREAANIDASKARPDSTASVSLKSYKSNDLSYTVRSANGGVVVFSEIWYGPDWHAEIDGRPAPYGRVNYVLRGMNVPAGEHTVRFYVKSKAYSTYGNVGAMGSWGLLVLVLVALGFSMRKEENAAAAE
jgi:hypothetical protein